MASIIFVCIFPFCSHLHISVIFSNYALAMQVIFVCACVARIFSVCQIRGMTRKKWLVCVCVLWKLMWCDSKTRSNMQPLCNVCISNTLNEVRQFNVCVCVCLYGVHQSSLCFHYRPSFYTQINSQLAHRLLCG